MINLEAVPSAEYHENPFVVAAIEDLNSAGMAGIDAATKKFQYDQFSMPLQITRPISELSDEPISSFDKLIVRSLGAANGHLVEEQLVLSALVAEITQSPVINVPFPNRDWMPDSLADKTKNWSKMSNSERLMKGVAHLDGYADYALQSIEQYIEAVSASGVISTTGESMGAALALSMASQAVNLDRSDTSLLALPNVETRHLYRKLFFRDFINSADGMEQEVMDSFPELVPFVEAHGFDVKKTKTEEIVDGLRYFAKDLFGLYPFDPRFNLYRSNRALTRTLTVPSAISMLERLNSAAPESKVHIGFFENDGVAKYTAFQDLSDEITSLLNTSAYLYPGGHSATNNPSIVGYAASLIR